MDSLLSELDELLHQQQRLMHIAFAANHRLEEKSSATKEEVEARGIPEGSRVYMWKLDAATGTSASTGKQSIRKIHLPHHVIKGPTDVDFQVVLQLETSDGRVEKDAKATQLAVPDENNDFLADIDGDPFAFDLVHTYAVCRLTLDMYQRDLGLKDWRWYWDLRAEPGTPRQPLRIIAHAGDKCNAVYHRGKRVLKFYHYTPKQGRTTYMCRCFDIVAHETGHAILDALKPELYGVKIGQSGALHESFADLTAIFSVLSQMDLCEEMVAETKGNIRKAKALSAIGEQFAEAVKSNEVKPTSSTSGKSSSPSDATNEDEEGEDEGGSGDGTTAVADSSESAPELEETGVRNANNTLRGTDIRSPRNIYGMACIFTAYVWDIVVKIYQWERNPALGACDAEVLYRTAQYVRRLLINALLMVSPVPEFHELSLGMERAVDQFSAKGSSILDMKDTRKYKEIIAVCRAERELQFAGKPRRVHSDLKAVDN